MRTGWQKSHAYVEVGRRTLDQPTGPMVEVLFGCSCQRFTQVVVASTLALARSGARREVRRHGKVAE